MLRVARTLLALRDPLDAEVVISELLGAWWAQNIPGLDLERLLGEELVSYATADGSPAALALLAGVASLGPSQRQRILAKKAVLGMVRQGTRRPQWAGRIGAVRPVAAYMSGSRFGDADDIVCVFRYEEGEDGDDPSEPSAGTGASTASEHAVIAVIDHNSGGVLRDAWVTTKVTELLARCRKQAEVDTMATFSELSPERARSLLESALQRSEAHLDSAATAGGAGEVTGRSSNGAGSEPLPKHHVLVRARARALADEPRSGRTPVWRRDRRSFLAARFLSSEAAADLSDSYAASRCVDHIIDYGCDVDFGRPLRVSPRKVETFLLSWLPRRVVLLPEEQEAMPHVLAAWVRWAGPRAGLPEEAMLATLDAVWESTAAFMTSYRDPTASFGLRREVIRRLLPDGDLSALPRRMFAFPLLASDLLSDDVGEFDPTTSAGRRALLKLDHFGEYDVDPQSRGRHCAASTETPAEERREASAPDIDDALDAHERLAERLWDGNPPSLWAAAQRLLDRGHTRPAVVETLLDVLEEAENDDVLAKRLDEL
ncbi:hypothetical protein [Salinactinospora qingdaonensis]